MNVAAGQDTHDETMESDLAGYRTIQLSHIVGLHVCLEQLYDELSIPPLRMVPTDMASEAILMDILTLHPLRLAKKNRRWRCTGNVRLYHLAKQFLPDTVKVPCLVEDLLPEAKIKQRAVNELIFGNAYLGAHFSDIKVLAEVARHACRAGYMMVVGQSIETLLSKLYRVDIRQLKAKPPAAAVTSGNQGIADHEAKAADPSTIEPIKKAAEAPLVGCSAPGNCTESPDMEKHTDGQE